MKRICAVLVVLSCIGLSFATYGVDVSSYLSTSQFQCLDSSGYSFAVVRCWESGGQPDPNCPATVANAWAGGMAHVDVYFFPCPGCGNAAGQVRSAVQFLNSHGTKFGMLWFDIEGPQYWSSSPANNIAFMKELLAEAGNQGLHIGIYTSESQWQPIMNGWTGGSGYPLWYAHYDGNPSFGDFSPFAGWSHPNIKQFVGDAAKCSADVDENWYP